MRRLHCCLLTFMLLFGTVEVRAGDDSDAGYRFATAVEEVRLVFQATDHQGRQVQVLEPDQIAVVDNERVIRHFSSFQRITALGLNVVVVVDTSGSINKHQQMEIDRLLRWIIALPWRESDHVSMVQVSQDPHLKCLRNCLDANAERMSVPVSGGLTPLFDTIIYAADAVAASSDVDFRSVIIVLTDGDDNLSRATLTDTVRACQRSDASIFAVDLSGKRTDLDARKNLEQLVSATDGLLLSDGRSNQSKLEAALSNQRSAYVLTYVPENRSEGIHAVALHLTHNAEMKFSCRRTYNYAAVHTGIDK